MWLWIYVTLWALYIIVAAIAAWNADDDAGQAMPGCAMAAFLFIVPGFIVMVLLGIVLYITRSI